MLLGAAPACATKGSPPAAVFRPACRGALCILVSIALGIVVFLFGRAAPLARWQRKIWHSGLGNPVAGVLFVYRALDTLLERLFCCSHWSASGPWRRIRRGEGTRFACLCAAEQHPRVSGSAVAANRHHGGIICSGAGANHPGGLPGGTILAAMWLLVMMARLGGAHDQWLWVRQLLVVGPAIAFSSSVFWDRVCRFFLAYPPRSRQATDRHCQATLTLQSA
jgi:hypothetical protein